MRFCTVSPFSLVASIGFLLILLSLDSVKAIGADVNTTSVLEDPTPNKDDCNATVISERKVVNHIFQNYSTDARPRRNHQHVVEVDVGLRLFAIKDFVERQNRLILNGFFSIAWKDELLAWNTQFPYSCVRSLLVKPEQLWKPDLHLISGERDFLSLAESTRVLVYNDGTSYQFPAGEIGIGCELDLTWFPFDTQICPIILESWSYPTTQQSLKPFSQPFIKFPLYWTENEQWEITGNTTYIRTESYMSTGSIAYDSAVYVLMLRRKPLFYYINIIIPSIMISVAEIVVFILPIAEVVKIHISFTCLLAYSVFEEMTTSEMPRSSTTVPLLSLYITLQMAYIAIIALLGEGIVFLFIRKADFGKSKPPKSLYSICWTLGKFLLVDDACFKSSHSSVHDGPGGPTAMFTQMLSMLAFLDISKRYHARHTSHQHQAANVRQPSDVAINDVDWQQRDHDSPSSPGDDGGKRHSDSHDERNAIREQWRLMAEVVERINMCLYVAAIVLTPAIMFNVAPPEKILQQPTAKTTLHVQT